jgi:hypothetical protein
MSTHGFLRATHGLAPATQLFAMATVMKYSLKKSEIKTDTALLK